MKTETVGTTMSVPGGISAALWYTVWCLTAWTPSAWLYGASLTVLLVGLFLLTLAYRND